MKKLTGIDLIKNSKVKKRDKDNILQIRIGKRNRKNKENG